MAGARVRFGLLALTFAVVCSARASAAPWRPCSDGFGADCTRVSVPLDRARPEGSSIGLRVARVQGPADAPPVMYLSGGPGAGGLEELEAVMWSIPGLTTSFRVFTYDQRGTGGSGLLRCRAIEHDPRLRSTAAGEACARTLGAARSHYTTPDSVEDLEAVRRALGIERLRLFGISYGTELALAYARTYPAHVQKIALDSAVDPDDADPFGLAGFRAMDATLRSLCPAGCRGVTGNPSGDIARLVARLGGDGLAGRVVDGRGRVVKRYLTAVALADLLYDADYAPPLRAGVPAAVRAALGGDAAPLLRLAAVGDALASLPQASSFSSARYAAVCEETPLPWDAATPLSDRWAEAGRRAAALGPGAFRPFDFRTAAADEIELCLRWPDVPRSRPLPAGPFAAVPALFLQGAEDLRTPPEVSASLAARIPGARRVVVEGVGHAVTAGDPTGCAAGVLLRFLRGADAGPAACPRVATGVPAVTIPPRRLADVPPMPFAALPMRLRRTATAVALTLDDVRFALSPALLARAGGGLRGGTYRDGQHGLVLDRYEAVGGVRLTGRWHGRRLRLLVTGPAAAPGTLTIDPSGRFRGVLGGRPITGRLAHRPPRPVSAGRVATTAARITPRAIRHTAVRIP